MGCPDAARDRIKVPVILKKLNVPPDEFRDVMDMCMTEFQQKINRLITKNNVKEAIVSLGVHKIKEAFQSWLAKCKAHQMFCIDNLLYKLSYNIN